MGAALSSYNPAYPLAVRLQIRFRERLDQLKRDKISPWSTADAQEVKARVTNTVPAWTELMRRLERQ